MSGSALVRRSAGDRARERSEIERRRVLVARYRWLEAYMTAAEIVTALECADPSIVVFRRLLNATSSRSEIRRIGTFQRAASMPA